MQKTTAQLESVDSEDDAQLAPRAQNKVRTCRAAGAVWVLVDCAQSKKGSRRQHFEVSNDNFITQSQVFCCVAVCADAWNAPNCTSQGHARTSKGLGGGGFNSTIATPGVGARAVQIGCPLHLTWHYRYCLR